MRFLVDANLSPKVARRLDEAGHDAVHVADIELLSATDSTILQVAAEQDRVVLTADSDFGALLALGGLEAPSAVLLRSSDHLRTDRQAELVLANLDAVEQALNEGAVATMTTDRVRLRSLPIYRKPGSE